MGGAAPSIGEAAERFRAEILGILGYAPDRIESGRIQRFATRNGRRDDAGWCLLFPDGEGGVFGDWRNGRQYHWQLDPVHWRNHSGRKQWQTRMAEARAAFQEAKEAEQRGAVGHAASLWTQSLEVDPGHPYLKRKGVEAHGIRQTPNGDLLIPLFGPDGEIQSVQFIRPDGEKRFLPGGKVSDGHYWIGDPGGTKTLLIGEGYATCASVYAATGHPTAVAFSGHNLEAVAQIVRTENPTATILICGDSDPKPDGSNPGQHYAERAARAIGTRYVLPVFGEGLPGTDFNDLQLAEGLGAIRAQIESALRASQELGVLDLSHWLARIRFQGEPEPRRWLIEGVFPLAQPALLAASGGIGKSFLLLQLAREVAAFDGGWVNAPILLGGTLQAGGTAVYLTAEDDAIEVHNRLRALGPEIPDRLYVVPLPNAGGVVPWFAPHPETKAPATTDAWHALEAQLRGLSDLRLVILDPLQPLCALDLNLPENAQVVCSRLAGLAATTGASVIVSHHFAKREASTPEQAREAIRGTGGLVDGVRAVYALWPPKEEAARAVCRTLGLPYIRGAVVTGGIVKANGKSDLRLTTFVRDRRGLLRDRTEEWQRGTPHQRELLSGLRSAIAEAAAEGKPYTKTGVNGVFERRHELPEAFHGLSKRALPEMVDALLAAKAIVQAMAGGSKSVKWLDVPAGRIAMGEPWFVPGHVERAQGGRNARIAGTASPAAETIP